MIHDQQQLSRRCCTELTERPEPGDDPDGRNADRDDSELAQHAQSWAQRLIWLPGAERVGRISPERFDALNRRLDTVLASAETRRRAERLRPLSEDLQWLHDNVRLLRATQTEFQRDRQPRLRRVPHVRDARQDRHASRAGHRPGLS